MHQLLHDQCRCLVNRGTMGVNSLPNAVTRQRRGFDLNPGRSAPESSTLTTRREKLSSSLFLRQKVPVNIKIFFRQSVVFMCLILHSRSPIVLHTRPFGHKNRFFRPCRTLILTWRPFCPRTDVRCACYRRRADITVTFGAVFAIIPKPERI